MRLPPAHRWRADPRCRGPATSHCPQRRANIDNGGPSSGMSSRIAGRSVSRQEHGRNVHDIHRTDAIARPRAGCSSLAALAGSRLTAPAPDGRRADLRLRHPAAGHAQPHHRVVDRQGAQGKGRPERAGAADRRRHGDHSHGRPRRGRDRHRQHHGGAGRARPAGFKDLRLIAAVHALRDAVLRAQGQRRSARPRISRASGWPMGYSAMRNLDRRSRAPCSPPPA